MVNVFVDVETTGFDYLGASVISLACIVDDNGTTYEFNQTGAPESEKYWSTKAEKIHGISYEQAITFQSQLELHRNFLDFIAPFQTNIWHPIPFWYHGNGNFDYRMLLGQALKTDLLFEFRKYFQHTHVFSTLKLAKNNVQLNKYSLDAICKYYSIELTHHDALSDTKACYQIWSRLVPHQIQSFSI